MSKRLISICLIFIFMAINVVAITFGIYSGRVRASVTLNLQGSGTYSDPYLISCKDDLYNFRDYINGRSNREYKYYSLTCDLDLGGDEIGIIGSYSNHFVGSFRGNQHCISNFKITASYDKYVGLFGYTKGANITGVVLDNFSVSMNWSTSARYVGGLIGYAVITHVYDCWIRNKAEITYNGTQDYVAGLVGYMDFEDSSIYSCSNSANVTGYCFAGGIVCMAVGEEIDYSDCIERCANYGAITLKSSNSNVSTYYNAPLYTRGCAGGIVGYDENVKVINCYNGGDIGDISAHSVYLGGIVGFLNKGKIQTSFNKGSVISTSERLNKSITYKTPKSYVKECTFYYDYTVGEMSSGILGGYISNEGSSDVLNCHTVTSKPEIKYIVSCQFSVSATGNKVTDYGENKIKLNEYYSSAYRDTTYLDMAITTHGPYYNVTTPTSSWTSWVASLYLRGYYDSHLYFQESIENPLFWNLAYDYVDYSYSKNQELPASFQNGAWGLSSNINDGYPCLNWRYWEFYAYAGDY